MKGFRVFIIAFLVFCAGCDLHKREDELQKKEAALNQKEQELLLKEQTLQLREAELSKKQQQIDSTQTIDTTYLVNPALVGQWSVEMTCTETTCTGSAVGDTRKEQWDISYQENTLVVRAVANDQLVRVYTGFFTGNTIELQEQKTNTAMQTPSKMLVRLRMVDETHMEGQREIVRENDCRVVFVLQLKKNTV